MVNSNRDIRNAFIVGLMLAFIEFFLVYTFDPNVGSLVLVQSILFWFSCGLLIYLTEFGSNYTLKGILVAVLMNIPWYINLSLIPGNYIILLPLIISSIILGAIGGFVRGWIKKKNF